MLKKKKMKATIRKSCHSVRSEVWVSVSSPCDLFIIVFTKPLSYPMLKLWASNWDLNPWSLDSNRAKIHGLLTEITLLVSGLNEAQVLNVSWQKEFSERQSIGKKWIYLGRDTLHRQSKVHLRRWELASRYFGLVFYGLGMNGRINLTISGKEWDFQELDHCPLFFFDGCPQNCHGTDGSIIYLGNVLRWAYTEAQW